jgi:hypothetical protein
MLQWQRARVQDHRTSNIEHQADRLQNHSRWGGGAEGLVDFLDRWAIVGPTTESARRATSAGEASARGIPPGIPPGTTSSAIQPLHNRVGDRLELLLLLLVLLLARLGGDVEPLDCLVDRLVELLLVCGVKLLCKLLVLCRVAQVVRVRLEAVLRRNPRRRLVVLLLVLLRISDHALDFFLGQTTLVVGDCDAVRLACRLIRRGHVQDTVGVDVECYLDLRYTTRSRRDTRKLELAKKVVVFCARTLALVDLDEHTGLVVRVGGEDLRLLRRNSRVALDERGHDTTSSLDTVNQLSVQYLE